MPLTAKNLHLFGASSKMYKWPNEISKKTTNRSFRNLWRVIGTQVAAEQAAICLIIGLFLFASTYIVLLMAPEDAHALALALCLIASCIVIFSAKFADAIEFVAKLGHEIPKNESTFTLITRQGSEYVGIILPTPKRPPRIPPSSTF